MITEEEIQKIFDWAKKYNIKNKGKSVKDDLGLGKQVWQRGIPKRKDNILKIEYLKIDDGWEDSEKIIEIPKELFFLPNLKSLNIENTSIPLLPNEAKILRSLSFNIKILGVEKKTLQNLTHIELSCYTYFENKINLEVTFDETVKNIIANLNSEIIEYFKIYCDEFEVLPKEIGNLLKLKYLDLNWCENLKELPKEIGKLVALKE